MASSDGVDRGGRTISRGQHQLGWVASTEIFARMILSVIAGRYRHLWPACTPSFAGRLNLTFDERSEPRQVILDDVPDDNDVGLVVGVT